MDSPDRPDVVVAGYRLIKTIGQGTYGKVKLGIHTQTHEKAAIKVIEKAQIKSSKQVARLQREIRFLKLLHHPHIVQVYDVIETHDFIYIVMEYAVGGELFDYIVANKRVKEREARSLFRMILSAIDYCHKNAVIHRDLKPENLLLDSQKIIKIIDFGFGNNYKTDGSQLDTFCGSPFYAAPEMILGKKYIGPEVDIWSLGVILFALLCGHLPFDDDNMKELYKRIASGTYRCPDYVSPNARHLISRLIQVDPKKRATLYEALAHPWVNEGYDCQPPSYVPRRATLDSTTVSHDIINRLLAFGYKQEEIDSTFAVTRPINEADQEKPNAIRATYHLLVEMLQREEIRKNLKQRKSFDFFSGTRDSFAQHRASLAETLRSESQDSMIAAPPVISNAWKPPPKIQAPKPAIALGDSPSVNSARSHASKIVEAPVPIQPVHAMKWWQPLTDTPQKYSGSSERSSATTYKSSSSFSFEDAVNDKLTKASPRGSTESKLSQFQAEKSRKSSNSDSASMYSPSSQQSSSRRQSLFDAVYSRPREGAHESHIFKPSNAATVGSPLKLFSKTLAPVSSTCSNSESVDNLNLEQNQQPTVSSKLAEMSIESSQESPPSSPWLMSVSPTVDQPPQVVMHELIRVLNGCRQGVRFWPAGSKDFDSTKRGWDGFAVVCEMDAGVFLCGDGLSDAVVSKPGIASSKSKKRSWFSNSKEAVGGGAFSGSEKLKGAISPLSGAVKTKLTSSLGLTARAAALKEKDPLGAYSPEKKGWFSNSRDEFSKKPKFQQKEGTSSNESTMCVDAPEKDGSRQTVTFQIEVSLIEYHNASKINCTHLTGSVRLYKHCCNKLLGMFFPPVDDWPKGRKKTKKEAPLLVIMNSDATTGGAPKAASRSGASITSMHAGNTRENTAPESAVSREDGSTTTLAATEDKVLAPHIVFVYDKTGVPVASQAADGIVTAVRIAQSICPVIVFFNISPSLPPPGFTAEAQAMTYSTQALLSTLICVILLSIIYSLAHVCSLSVSYLRMHRLYSTVSTVGDLCSAFVWLVILQWISPNTTTLVGKLFGYVTTVLFLVTFILEWRLWNSPARVPQAAVKLQAQVPINALTDPSDHPSSKSSNVRVAVNSNIMTGLRNDVTRGKSDYSTAPFAP